MNNKLLCQKCGAEIDVSAALKFRPTTSGNEQPDQNTKAFFGKRVEGPRIQSVLQGITTRPLQEKYDESQTGSQQSRFSKGGR